MPPKQSPAPRATKKSTKKSDPVPPRNRQPNQLPTRRGSNPGPTKTSMGKAYNKLKIARVTRPDGLVSCDYAVQGASIGKRGEYFLTVDGKKTNIHRVAFLGDYDTRAVTKEIMHICGNRICCRPEHMIKAKMGGNVYRRCYGYIRFGSNDQLAKVCPHDPPCRIVTEYSSVEDIVKLPSNGKAFEGCCGTVTCGDLSAKVCRHKRLCSTVTDIEAIRASSEDVDPADKRQPRKPRKIMTEEEVIQKYDFYIYGKPKEEEEEESSEEEEESSEESEEEEPPRVLTRRAKKTKTE